MAGIVENESNIGPVTIAARLEIVEDRFGPSTLSVRAKLKNRAAAVVTATSTAAPMHSCAVQISRLIKDQARRWVDPVAVPLNGLEDMQDVFRPTSVFVRRKLKDGAASRTIRCSSVVSGAVKIP